MNRREFLTRAAAAAATMGLPGCMRAAMDPADPTRTPAARADTTAAPGAGPMAPRAESVSIAAGGDTTLGYNLEAHFDQQLAAGMSKERLWPLYFAGLRSLMEAADLAVVNLECPFTARGQKLPKNFNFRARPELVRILTEGSVDVVSLANNHTADFGRDGVRDTMDTLDRAGIARFGAGMHLKEARRPVVVERNGLKLGFVGWYYQADPDMIEPEAVYATPSRAGVAGCYKDLDCMRQMIIEDLEQLVPRVDAVIPFFHWGKEGSYEVRDYQVQLAHLCVDHGARAVLGAHPHRLQGVEVYRGAPIFYSLGNFVYGGIKEPRDTLTAVARLRISRERTEADLVPVQFTQWPERAFQPFVLEGEEREAAMRRIAGYSRSFVEPLPQLLDYLPDAQLAPGGK
jgi:poly-gamma-glutamate synthesis protein (capsule biosynthesis protein)